MSCSLRLRAIFGSTCYRDRIIFRKQTETPTQAKPFQNVAENSFHGYRASFIIVEIDSCQTDVAAILKNLAKVIRSPFSRNIGFSFVIFNGR